MGHGAFVAHEPAVVHQAEQQARDDVGELGRIGVRAQMAVTDGLQSVSFGEVAKRLDISKSAVFFHTGSLLALQRLVLDEYDRRFSEEIFVPALKAERGLPRLDAIVGQWILCCAERRAISGAIFAVGAFEMHARLNPLHERLLASVTRWREVLERTIAQAARSPRQRPAGSISSASTR